MRIKIKTTKPLFFPFKKVFNVYLFLGKRERQSMSGAGAEREGDTESEAGSRLWAVSTEPDAGLKLTDREILTWAKVGMLNRLSQPGAPSSLFLVDLYLSEKKQRDKMGETLLQIWWILPRSYTAPRSLPMGRVSSVGVEFTSFLWNERVTRSQWFSECSVMWR